jgi:conjugal transfer/type IV secretion protein DotA/TraY
MRLLSYIFLLLLSPSAFAAIFNPPSTDLSLKLLGSIFGPNIGSLILDPNANLQPVLSQIIEKLNLIVVTLGMGIAGYVVVMSITNTAHEGTVMGKKWSAVWIPMRSIMGLGLMVPSPGSGYSLIQATVMWVVVNGIGAADQLWAIVINGLTSGVTMTGENSSIGPLKASIQLKGKEIAQELLRANVCMKSLQKLTTLGPGAEKNTPEDNLYQALHPSTQPQELTDLFKYGNQLAMYEESATIGTAPTENKTSQIISFNFGANGGNGKWRNICGSIQATPYVSAGDYPSSNYQLIDKKIIEKDLQTVVTLTRAAITEMNNEISQLADAIVNNAIEPKPTEQEKIDRDLSYRLLAQSATKEDLFPQGYFDSAALIFLNKMEAGVIPDAQNSLEKTLNKLIKRGETDGWILLSSYYFILAQNSSSPSVFTALGQNNDKLITYSPTPPKCTKMEKPITSGKDCFDNAYGDDNPYRYSGTFNTAEADNLSTTLLNISGKEFILGFIAMNLAQAEVYATVDGNFSSDTKQLSSVLNFGGSSGNAGIIDSTAALMHSYSSDPIIAHAKVGYNMMATSEAGFAALIVQLIAMATFAGILASDYFGFNIEAPRTLLLMTILPQVFALILPALLIMWTMGASFYMYIPLIPFMIFMVTALGWLVSVIEAVVAAPIMALGLVTPSGDELGKAATGIGLLANLFLKPSLMIIGFMFAAKLYKGAVDLVNWGMAENYRQLGQSTAYSWMAALGIYLAFISTLANKCFALIHILPDKIMRWLGNQGESTDATSELSAAKSGQEGANKAGEATASGVSKGADKGAEKAGKKQDAIAKKKADG